MGQNKGGGNGIGVMPWRQEPGDCNTVKPWALICNLAES